jgi:anti-anti-sigma factor
VVVALDEVRYVSSSGIGSLVRLYKRIRDCGGKVCISGASRRLRDLFEVAGVEQLLELTDDVAQGIARLRASATSETGGGA